MFELRRTVRFCLNHGISSLPDGGRVTNGFAGWPSMVGLGCYYELEVACRGEPDRRTGFVMNITAIDHAVRRSALPVIHRALLVDPLADPRDVLPEVVAALQAPLAGHLGWVRWRLTPYYSITMDAAHPQQTLLAQQFEFAASHRLHSLQLSDEENRRLFGRCNNARGHGHNYRLEVVVEVPAGARTGPNAFSLAQLESIVHDVVLRRFDHRHLNEDIPEFATLTPTVEQIARVCHDLLLDPVLAAGGRLRQVTVWETEKTSCTYASAADARDVPAAAASR
jgi:6-pyruvoyltetrahydropterin/6-carboxytetrahydropterin synthase